MQQAESAKTSTQNFKVQHPLAVGLVSFRTKLTFLASSFMEEELRCMQYIDLPCKIEAPGNMMRAPGFWIIHKADIPLSALKGKLR